MENAADDTELSFHRSGCRLASASQAPLYSLLERLHAVLTGPFDRQTIWQLHRQINQQAALIREADIALAGAEIFERASVAASMGTWRCELPSEQLTWSGGTYDLFGFHRSHGLVRGDILRTYSEESLARLQKVRSDAIETGSGFKLDAEIQGPDIGKRWIRIFATVERQNGEPIRLFGIKQDITEERTVFEHMRHLAEHDVMTGLANRTQFQVQLAKICGPSGSGGALMLIDLDEFKEINDTLGHGAGDECLIEFTRRLSTICQCADLIARIGGDEFAVLFSPATDRHTIERVAQRLVDAAKAPMNYSGSVFNVSASVGVAFAEGETPTALFTKADHALYAAKAIGGDAFQG
ncbi:sensor domain-containing diguanylate cyclase [Rhizobium miluonense]|uniref:Diguanylate cyclase (GGDEF) domain-containing protein n=1 Tax=Rhizobium miluonense TaxID=411945 RepID=A0A1C3V083_9HYPH|nr:sensor domain-containing diguanylate cyclase [Rhizobium miluonense]SCB21068.1 diguanylate cyclase (GGDEF) domain-containing protein [Rhizobium miluonense]